VATTNLLRAHPSPCGRLPALTSECDGHNNEHRDAKENSLPLVPEARDT
jgi:hypothetical protein